MVSAAPVLRLFLFTLPSGGYAFNLKVRNHKIFISQARNERKTRFVLHVQNLASSPDRTNIIVFRSHRNLSCAFNLKVRSLAERTFRAAGPLSRSREHT